jgi:hypothetical protein
MKCKYLLLEIPLWMIFLSFSSAQDSAAIGKPDWTGNPTAIRQTNGKYPSTANVVLFWNLCVRDATGKVTNPLDPSDAYRITPSGTGLSAGPVTVGPCSLTTSISINLQEAQSGYQYLMVSKQPKNAPAFVDAGLARFTMLDAQAGPTPSTPEVDIQWKVYSQHACSDTFGNHVAKIFYCVQVTIGNNSAHSLQISSIGFRTPNPLAGVFGVASNASITETNTSYRTTRAVAQNGQSTSFRNILVNSVQGLGLIMASFTPYFHNPVSSSKWATGSAIVSGVFGQAINLVAPDLTIRELNSLDDESLRDGKLIPNNTEVPPVNIFVDKKEVTEALAALQHNLSSLDLDKRSVGQKILLDELNTCVQKQTCGPMPIKLALGNIVLVGDSIDYIQRIVVDPSVTSQEVPTGPVISNSAGLTATAGSTTTATLTGTNLDKISGVALDSASKEAQITLGGMSLSGTTGLSVPITVPSGFHGPITLNFTSTTGSVTPIVVTVQ